MTRPAKIAAVAPEQLATGAVALAARGDQLRASRAWREARTAYEQAVAADAHHAPAWEGLGHAARYTDDLETSHSAFEQAYRDYLDSRDHRGAARAAMEIALYHDVYRGEPAVANGWFERAGALLEDCPDTPERAWLLLWRAHVHIHVRDEMRAGREALAGALRLNLRCQVDEIDTMAKGLAGLSLISDGDVESGLRRLDEATATAIAGDRFRPETIGFTCCYVLDACETVRDFARAQQWLEHARSATRSMAVRHFESFCRSHYIAVLTWSAKYEAAESAIGSMRSELAAIAPAWMAHCDLRLGEVRRRQGRAEEAVRLLQPLAAHSLALLPLAWLRFEAGDPDGTLSLVERYVRRTAGDHVRRLHALDLIVRAASLARDDARTTMAIEELRGLAPKVNTRIALGVLAEAEASDPALQPAAAVVKLEDAIDEYDLAGAPYEGTAARLRLASVLTTAGQSDRGAREREAAKAVAARIGALGILKRAAAEPYGAPAQRRRTSLSERELEVLGLIAQGLSNHDIGERLCVSPFTVKRHVANILTKLDLPSRAAAASYAVRNGLT
jgi:LuxR family transcriptional regulator, maltose regulon positive regulatory protein